MFPEDSTDVHLSSASSSSSTLSSSSSIKSNTIPIESEVIRNAIESQQQSSTLLATRGEDGSSRGTGQAQAVCDIVIEIPTISAAAAANTSSDNAMHQTASAASIITIDCDRPINRNENVKNCKKSTCGASAATAAASYQHFKCIPPPLFVILVSIIEIVVFVYESWFVQHHENYNNEEDIPIPSDSILVYRPDRRQEVWRFFSYMVLHANWFHLGFNVIVQLLFGLPLEYVHGSMRTGCIYLAGVVAGSLGTSVVDSKVYLVGASGGVYALLGAHLANILLNHTQIKYASLKLVSIVVFGLCDIGFAVYKRYFEAAISSSDMMLNAMPPVSYVAHLSGALAGLTIGLLVLKNFPVNSSEVQCQKQSPQRHLLWWTALGIYMAFIIFTITFNVMNTMTAQIIEEKGQVIKQYLFHNLGSS